jgi:hypothetical protein
MPEGEDDVELLIGVYSSDEEARAAIERVKDKPGLADFPLRLRGVSIHP